MMGSGASRTVQGTIQWVLFLALVLLPFEWLFISGLWMAQSSLVEAASFIARQDLEGTLFSFRSILEPDTILTRRLERALEKARSAKNPREWHAAVGSGLGDFPEQSFDLLLTNGTSMIPASDTWNPATFSAFLASMTARAQSLSSPESAVKYMRATQKEIESFGNERLSIQRWIDLPIFPGISNRIFDTCWEADRATSILATPRNTWAAFGTVSGCPGWRYLALFHRQSLSTSFLREAALKEAWKIGLSVDLPDVAKDLSRPAAVMDPQGPRRVQITRADERSGTITAVAELPKRLWTLFVLGMIANLSFGLAVAALAFRFFIHGSLDEVKVGRKITFGLLGGMGLPILLTLYTADGMMGTSILRATQACYLEMEQSTQKLDAEFTRFIDTVSADHRRDLKAIGYPWVASTSIPLAEAMAARHMVSHLQIISSEGVKLFVRGPYPWSPFRVGFRPREERVRRFQDWCRRGYFLLDHELDLLSLDTPDSKTLSPQQLWAITRREGKNPARAFNPKLLEMIAKRVCATLNKVTAADSDMGKADPGVMLDIAFKGKEAEFFQDILANLGRLRSLQMANSTQMAFVQPIKDGQGRTQSLAIVFQRLSDLGEQYFYKVFRRPFEQERFTLLALSRFYGKVSFGSGLDATGRETIERVLADPGQSIRCIRGDEHGQPRMLLGVRSMVLPEYIYVVSMPVETLLRDARRQRDTQLLVMGFLFFLALGIAWWLRTLLVTPLGDLQQVVVGMANGSNRMVKNPLAIGEIGALSDLFDRTLDSLRQMDLAKTIQEDLLPQGPVCEGAFEMCGKSVMMSQVGGDYFDLIPRGKGRFLVVVGDVSGHGLPAAIIVSMVKSAFMLLAETSMESNEMLVMINDIMFKTLARRKMMTCLLGTLDTATGEFRYSNAGHNFPYLKPPEGAGAFVKQTNLPLGSMRNRPYKIDAITIAEGGALVLYTDGVSEATDPENKILGYEKLGAFLGRVDAVVPEEAAESVLEFVRGYSQGVPWQDDVTVLFVKHGRAIASNVEFKNTEAGG